MEDVDALVVGGSIAAHAATRALSRAIPKGRVLRAGPATGDLSVLLWRRGRRALTQLGIDDQTVRSRSIPVRTLRYRDATLAILSQVDLDDSEARFMSKNAITTLLGEANPPLAEHSQASASDLERGARGFRARLESPGNPKVVRTRALVGAAGVADPVRELAFGRDGYSESSSIVVGRGTTWPTEGWAGEGVAELVLGRDSFIGFMPAQDATGAWTETVWWLSSTTRPLLLTAASPETAIDEFLRNRFSPVVAEAVRRCQAQGLRELPSRPWVHPGTPAGADRIALVGDSFRAATPELGLGVTWALEDAVRLGECVGSRGLVPGIAEYAQTTSTQGESVIGRAFAGTIVSERGYEGRRGLLSHEAIPRWAARMLDAATR
jgi:2-polyprenyl-6-methoxyphenol hydroxylase-like FAD-dependent oxidoreductase